MIRNDAIAAVGSCDASSQKVVTMPSSCENIGAPIGWPPGPGDEASQLQATRLPSASIRRQKLNFILFGISYSAAMNLGGHLRIGTFLWITIQSTLAVPGDQNWDDRFGLAPGFNGAIRALLVVETNLYVGGDFTAIGDLEANGIARWDGTKWHALGSGIAGQVRALANDGTNLYAGGLFYQAGECAVTNIALWNGEAWSDFGGLMTGEYPLFLPNEDGTTRISIPGGVETLIVKDSKLYVGGSFSRAGDIAATNIAVWDGLQWTTLGDGLSDASITFTIGTVKALAFDGISLFAAGYFNASGANRMTNIAVWDGFRWNPLAGGLSTATFHDVEHVTALGSINGRLLVGGRFSRAGNVAATNLAWWNGSEWSAIPGAPQSPGGILMDAGGAILMGEFSNIGSANSSGVARFDGTNWSGYSRGVVGSVEAAVRFGTNLYVGGNFQIAGGVVAGFIARWNGQEWESLFPGMSGALLARKVDSMVADSGGVYLSGKLISGGPTPLDSVAHFDGTNWISMDEGLSADRLHLISIVETNIYLIEKSEFGTPELRRWNGRFWELIENSIKNESYTTGGRTLLAAEGTNLYLAGTFTSATGILATNLMRWDGSQWQSMNHTGYWDQDPFQEITGMAGCGERLFILEEGSETPPISEERYIRKSAISFWDGTIWNRISSNLQFSGDMNFIQTMACLGSNLFVGGYFVITNPIVATNFIRWDGNEWHAVDHTFTSDSFVFSLASNETNLYAEGWFYETNGCCFHRTVKWDGLSWSTLGSGLDVDAYPAYGIHSKIATSGRDVYFSGQFTLAGCNSSYQFALWHDFPNVSLRSRGRLPNGKTGFSILGGNGQPVEVQRSSDLKGWENLGVQLPDSESFDFEDDSPSTEAGRFFRLRLLP